MMNTIGQSTVPAVKLSVPPCPNRFQCSGAIPSVSSSAKILTPMNSASTALAQKNAASATNRRVARSSSRRMLQGDLAGGGANGMVSGRHRAAADDEAHRLVHRPVGRGDLLHRHDLEVAGGRVGRGRHVHRRQLAAGAALAHHPGDEAQRLHLVVREVDQHHALGAVGLGLQDVQQLARAAVDGAGQRNARRPAPRTSAAGAVRPPVVPASRPAG